MFLSYNQTLIPAIYPVPVVHTLDSPRMLPCHFCINAATPYISYQENMDVTSILSQHTKYWDFHTVVKKSDISQSSRGHCDRVSERLGHY